MRKLATVRTISELVPIPGADRIEIAKMKGMFWQCVVGKGVFKPGDKVIYFEIDSLLPITEYFSYLDGKCGVREVDGVPGYRIKTIEIRGVMSQGMVVPYHDFLDTTRGGEIVVEEDGTDVSEEIGVRKYETERSDGIGIFPGWARTTDAERLQNLPEYFELYSEDDWEATLKMDGTSCSFMYDPEGDFKVCGRECEIADGNNHYWAIARELKMKERMEIFHRGVQIAGEICGPGIQKNRANLNKWTFFLFNIFDASVGRYLNSYERFNFLHNLNGMGDKWPEILHVPVLGSGKLLKEYPSFEALLEWVESQPGYNGTRPEGVVFKNKRDPNISFKLISNKYLLKSE